MKILDELTFLHVRDRRVEHPVARRSGAVQLSGRLHGGAGLLGGDRRRRRRTSAPYLLKGGFVIFDDFRGDDWDNLQDQMRRVLPEARWIQLDGTSRCSTRSSRSITRRRWRSRRSTTRPDRRRYWGLFENNDPTKRLMVDRQREQRHQRVLGVLGHRLLRRSTCRTKRTSSA